MANNTAISAKNDLHRLLNESDRLSAYRSRIHDVAKRSNGFNERNKYGSNKAIQKRSNTDMRRKRLQCYMKYCG